MPPANEWSQSLDDVARGLDCYPVQAFEFVRNGLAYTVNKVYGPTDEEHVRLHVTGEQLCQGLREYALLQWGMLAGMVLRRWNLAGTLDFGRIVFALINGGLMQKNEDDSIEDFRGVYDFKEAFDSGYKIEAI